MRLKISMLKQKGVGEVIISDKINENFPEKVEGVIYV